MKTVINYNLYNLSTAVTTPNLQNMAKAINNFLVTLCNDWNLNPIQLVIGTYNSHIPIPNNSILIMDYTDVDGALGYHYELNGNAIAKVFAKTILGYGGVVMYRDSSTFTVAQCLCHELLEMIGNPQTNRWAMDNDGILWAMELCDAVESNLIVYTLPGNVKVGLSDYILPAWFSPDSTRGPYNKLNTIHSPFTVDSGGYSIILAINDGYIDTVYGSTHQSGTASLVSINANDIASDVAELKEKYKLKSKS
jgi:hypothetical protein